MKRFLRRWLAIALALGATAWILDGVSLDGPLTLAVAAIVFGFLNAVVKPVAVLLSLPITLLTLGLFYLVLNGAFFALAAWLVPGFEVAGFGWAVAGALVMALLSTMLEKVIVEEDERD